MIGRVSGVGRVDGAAAGAWRPLRTLGAASTMSLALPAAAPTPSQLYAPRGVLLRARPDGRTTVVAADTGNHRLMVWPDLPEKDGADCALVIGQPDPTSEGPQAGGRGPRRGLHLPTGLTWLPEGAVPGAGPLLLVADGWNHRLLAHPAEVDGDDPEPVWLLGQDDLDAVQPNRGGDVDGAGLYWPFGVAWHEGWLWVADTGNRRVLGWRGMPGGVPGTGASGPAERRPADVVLGQDGPDRREENRGGAVGASTFRWPHDVAVLGGVLWVADAGNHRLLGWRLPVTGDRPADLVLGQAGFEASREMPHVPQGPAALRFPYAVAAFGGGTSDGSTGELLVADTANNRVLSWADPVAGSAAAQAVLGQDDFDAAGENRWTAVTADSLCWPYGLATAVDPRHGRVLAVADSGNNRVVLWARP